MWLPLLEPYELKCDFGISLDIKCCPDGALWGILPAGEIWSVVTVSPSSTKTLAPLIGTHSGNSKEKSSKNGTFWI